MSKFFFDRPSHIRSGWNISTMLRRGPLTDKKIEKYRKLGYYSNEFRQARKDLMKRKQEKREGNFRVEKDGRMIYDPK